MNDDYKDLLDRYNILYSKVAVTDYFIADFKAQQNLNTTKLEELKERINKLEIKVSSNFKDVEYSIVNKVDNLESKIDDLDQKINSLSNNSFLQTVNSMDLKKWATLIGIIISILASAGVLDSIISPSFTEDQLNNKIEELIKFTN